VSFDKLRMSGVPFVVSLSNHRKPFGKLRVIGGLEWSHWWCG